MHPMYSPIDVTSFFTRFATETEDISMQLFNTVSEKSNPHNMR
jgi:hypothetical protein